MTTSLTSSPLPIVQVVAMGLVLGNIPSDKIEGIATAAISHRHGFFLGPFIIGQVFLIPMLSNREV